MRADERERENKAEVVYDIKKIETNDSVKVWINEYKYNLNILLHIILWKNWARRKSKDQIKSYFTSQRLKKPLIH